MFRDMIYDPDNYSSLPGMYLDVPFVPTDDNVIAAMLKLANLTRKDVLYDLGCGDGRIVVAAARDHDVRAVGVEIDPLRIADAMEYAGDSRVEYLVDFVEENIFTVDFSAATVVTLYLLDSVNLQLRPRLLQELRPGTRIISHAFGMGDWKPDVRLELGGTRILKWIVPAKVAGTWAWEGLDGRLYRVKLTQKFQQVRGSAWIDEQAATLLETTLYGSCLDVVIRDAQDTTRRYTLHFENGELQTIQEEDESPNASPRPEADAGSED